LLGHPAHHRTGGDAGPRCPRLAQTTRERRVQVPFQPQLSPLGGRPGDGNLASTVSLSRSAFAASCVRAARPPGLNLRERRLQSLVHAM
jgi:hypothetical protein